MLSNKEIKRVDKDLHTYHENIHTQPISKEKVFNRSDLLTCGWLPLCPSSKLKKNTVRSFSVFNQRVAVFRKTDGSLSALDAFCPHMGTDLGNGKVINNQLQCYLHQWKFDEEGHCSKLKNKKLQKYPVEEKYGYIWIFPDSTAPFTVPSPPGLENQEVEGIHLFKTKLFVHHHILMAGGIDLQHFKSVHNLDINFQYDVSVSDNNQNFIWGLKGNLPQNSILQKIAHYITGGIFKYQALFSGGSITSLTYGNDLYFRNKGFKLPTTSILWAATPHHNGVSDVDIFLVLKKEKGLIGFVKKQLKILFALILQIALKDDDVKAFPHMRYNVTNPSEGDRSVLDLINRINSVHLSPWGENFKEKI
ncbi:Rieske 2Fe-2S domain-containing protein [Bacteriovorax sp. PP10]|uniref:Rieske 2Fe-2S domain-containing protein n=1 Tax=Bacteriovorax antarcticus TaxID=3088717 RepID=A0ABU5VXD5_9BACT|nr:Rieske 2Fe-2S domain-containing protein [Bacteriovorax sp. PP10]MEA9356984.1 Rieske 2Fe-2S domain-containing protein [Bacteriovorax sp. PP10]